MQSTLDRWKQANRETGFTDRWPAFNRHLWRASAMYAGGDVEFAEFPGALAGQRLHNYRQPAPDQPQEFVSVCDDSFTGLGRLRRRFDGIRQHQSTLENQS